MTLYLSVCGVIRHVVDARSPPVFLTLSAYQSQAGKPSDFFSFGLGVFRDWGAIFQQHTNVSLKNKNVRSPDLLFLLFLFVI
jgi:hypothetical protein